MNAIEQIKSVIRDVPNFPKEGIIFKDLTPILLNPELCTSICDLLVEQIKPLQPDALVAMDSRGFWFGLMVANKLGIPMIPIRKAGKLPYKTVSTEYALEYGTAKVEMHEDVIQQGWKVLIHDDLLATGGTAEAASRLITQQGASVCGYSFLVELDFLEGKQKLTPYSKEVHSLIHY
ncbi:MAG: adenine phosphoribosyltransferase [Bacteroidota bacterium]|jgi:adenine phosphoribosyltransferase